MTTTISKMIASMAITVCSTIKVSLILLSFLGLGLGLAPRAKLVFEGRDGVSV